MDTTEEAFLLPPRVAYEDETIRQVSGAVWSRVDLDDSDESAALSAQALLTLISSQALAQQDYLRVRCNLAITKELLFAWCPPNMLR